MIQPILDSFDIKSKVEQILIDGSFADKRARTMDIDDFLRQDSFYYLFTVVQVKPGFKGLSDIQILRKINYLGEILLNLRDLCFCQK